MQTSVCDALNKNGHPCRGYGRLTEHGGYLCHMHTHFFDAPDNVYDFVWKSASMFQSERDRQWIIRMLQSRSCVNRLSNSLPQYLVSQLTATDFQEWSSYTRGKAEYVYEIFVQASVIEPTRILALWKSVVSKQLRVLKYCLEITQCYDTIILKYLTPFFRGCKPGFVLSHLFQMMTTSQLNSTNGALITHTIKLWTLVFASIFKVMNTRVLIGSTIEQSIDEIVEAHRRKYPASTLLNKEIQEVLFRILRFHKEEQMKKMKARVASFKEDLIAKVWSPARVFRLIESGLEPEDF